MYDCSKSDVKDNQMIFRYATTLYLLNLKDDTVSELHFQWKGWRSRARQSSKTRKLTVNDLITHSSTTAQQNVMET